MYAGSASRGSFSPLTGSGPSNLPDFVPLPQPAPAAALRSTLDERLIDMIRGGADIYVRRWQQYAKGLKRID